ncbi:MAG TPA: CPBP family intramembrane glutamic endopeptidase [Ohtaekwangia sp.]
MELEASRGKPHPWVVVLISLLAVFLGFQLIGLFAGILLISPFYEGTLVEMMEALARPTNDPDMKLYLYCIQGCGAIIGFIVVPYFILQWIGQSYSTLLRSKFHIQPLVLVTFIAVAFMGVNSIFIEWNEKLRLPEFLSGVEDWARAMEDRLKEMTDFLTRFDSFPQFLIAFVVIAILPGIGEEIVFRGIIQRELIRGTNNIHLSIWLAAAIFSGFHFQFYGFVPRMLLGALFGYLYYWSGSLWLAMLAHFVNNGLMVLAMYFYQQGLIDIDIESTEAVSWSGVLFSAVITSILLYLFKTFYDKQPSASSGEQAA